jgi:cell fate regulator YaaT (PSP1 superfamily)
MPIVCGIKFRGTGKVYYFAPGDLTELHLDDHVIVETARGREMGQVVAEIHEVDDAEIVGELKPIVRRATTTDLLDAQRYQRQEAEAAEKCKEQVERFGLPMKVVNAEYSYDGSRLTFFFTSEQRVDFRELVRELARIFRVRIELRQIGVRDEAKAVGGIGKCGRPLCCATWLNEFYPVSIRMAKQQDLPLSPMEISGLCGRLLCCLGYEHEYYKTVKGRFPKVGKVVASPLGQAKVVNVSVLRETVTLLLEDGETAELTADELAGKVPIRQAKPGALDESQAQALDEVVGPATGPESITREEASDGRSRARADRPASTAAAPANAAPPTDGGGTPAGQAPAATSSRSGRSRRRRARRPRGERPAAPQQEAAAPSPSQGETKERTQATRRRPRRRRSRKPSASQDRASSDASTDASTTNG